MSKQVTCVAKLAAEPFGAGPFIGIDRGAFLLAKAKQQMLAAIGDFDSVNVEELSLIKEYCDALVVLPREKDETDSEYALQWARDQGFDRIRLLGATQGRADHFLANVMLMAYRFPTVQLVDAHNSIRVCTLGTYPLVKAEYAYVSLLCLVPCTITIAGVKYPLSERSLHPGDVYTISNEIESVDAELTVHTGNIILIQSKDAS